MSDYYYWRLDGDDNLYGPTFCSHNSPKEALQEIKEIMGVKELPETIRVVPTSKVRVREIDKTSKELKNFIANILKDIPYEFEFDKYGFGIKPKIGNSIRLRASYKTVKFNSYGDGKEYRLDDDDQREAFVKEISKRLQDRVNRSKKQKTVKGRITKIGNYNHAIYKTIEKAIFSIYLDPDQKITEADAHIIGEIKFYKKSWRRVMFDIDGHKIFTRDGKKEIKAENTNEVINKLLECLGGAKKSQND